MNFNDLKIEEILQGLEAETAKSLNEIRHAQDDLEKAENRQKFTLAVIHHLKQRKI
jgi:hypothetical protein